MFAIDSLIKFFCCVSGRPRREVEAETPDLCQDATIDAVTTTEDRRTYLFKGDYYWELIGLQVTRIADGYPRKISEDWGGLPGNLDAALTWANGNTFFFKENEYWSFINKKMDSGYPKEISVGFEGIPNNIDAVFVWSGNGKTYFFKGSEYWRYIEPNEPPISTSYPLLISTWEGLPNNIDAALHWDNKETFFFKGKSYYRFDDELSSVAKDDRFPPYPRPTSVWWFDCQEQSTSNEDLTTVSLDGDDMHPTNIGEDDNIRTSTQITMETDYLDSSEKLDVDLQQDGGDDLTTPSSRNEVLDTNSAASSCASLLLSLLLVAIL
ncbi:Matrix metalloproteinase-16 [Araneus ventricosus]|uniref:Matrix metalloproteinase-16 n=1 Tax=Araneus ventricosus TaxID=182803 RepID=A0A4Y2IU88_ARAVE|nr:Matrix metalloproteinase-16 [Araneus ventricosus]